MPPSLQNVLSPIPRASPSKSQDPRNKEHKTRIQQKSSDDHKHWTHGPRIRVGQEDDKILQVMLQPRQRLEQEGPKAHI